ncbi:guanine nucleotide binding protein, alpha subunit [Polychytrium aggregatum]|uniref:guanine nucleotide binding protein, alpha subunit n=1 Tax=Polychytrium aggregatum TaxID=110093 RepID=UPI0022FEE8DF|nr:guanine nucleotide binding protein, alpha subunit [Polychytrium aggregatum]KAI9199719.1 guanine nucleotide binding protein, alpha subunit [Polychytrium aggregatum]
MRSCFSIDGCPADKESIYRSKSIDVQIKQDAKAKANAIKLLLLGSGESGKSTILKQFRLVYGEGFTADELKFYKIAVVKNVVTCVTTLWTQAQARNIHVTDSTQEWASIINDLPTTLGLTSVSNGEIPRRQIPANIIQFLVGFWKNPGIQACFGQSTEFYLPDCCEHFLKNIASICHIDYNPSEQDVLQARIMTTTITQHTFMINKVPYQIIDVGGQRSERRKWFHYFDDVRAILFVAAVGSYDQNIIEDGQTNRMVEALTVFEQVANHPSLESTAILLFMNKIDLFNAKLADPNKSFKKYFPDYTGPNRPKPIGQYFTERFKNASKNPERKLYFYFTQATDTHQIRTILKLVGSITMELNLQYGGLVL